MTVLWRSQLEHDRHTKGVQVVRKVIGTILLIVGGFLIIVLFAGGGQVWPHVIGPFTLAIIGVILLGIKSKAKQS
jgi:hypothetical protein